MAAIDCLRFTGQIQLLRNAHRCGKRWIVFPTVYRDGDKLLFFFCYTEAEEACLRNENCHCSIGELLALLRLVSPEPKQPYQWSAVFPVVIDRILHCLTAISHYEVQVTGAKTKPAIFPEFWTAYNCFKNYCGKDKQVALTGFWKRHPLGQSNAVLYKMIPGSNEIFQLLDPCTDLHLQLVFFERRHANGNAVGHFDSCLRKVKYLNFGTWMNTDLFCEFENLCV